MLNIENIDFSKILEEIHRQVEVYEKALKEGTLKTIPKEYISPGI